MVNDNSLHKFFQLIKSAADGHCIMHSISSCVHHYNPSVHKHDIYDFLLHSLRTECLKNSESYSPLFQTVDLFDNERDRYIFEKQFDLSFVDLVPQMFANVLNSNIIIVNIESDSYNIYEFCPTKEERTDSPYVSKILHCPKNILLYRKGYHYDGYVPVCSIEHGDLSMIDSTLVSDAMHFKLPETVDGLGPHGEAGSRDVGLGVVPPVHDGSKAKHGLVEPFQSESRATPPPNFSDADSCPLSDHTRTYHAKSLHISGDSSCPLPGNLNSDSMISSGVSDIGNSFTDPS